MLILLFLRPFLLLRFGSPLFLIKFWVRLGSESLADYGSENG